MRDSYRCNMLPHQLLFGRIGSNIRRGAPGAAMNAAVIGGAAGDATATGSVVNYGRWFSGRQNGY
ncbi:hypothetical protein [Paraburkholderia sp. BL10I2N1]|uniref:hypothetical protein n=1 Tax=Paraburkholderia sp. BL10I2N1 TaxID=1938796 RepID=UPI00105DE49C|nr:hypothetical protein [Paraburkholderia sp. BL10I2N1]